MTTVAPRSVRPAPTPDARGSPTTARPRSSSSNANGSSTPAGSSSATSTAIPVGGRARRSTSPASRSSSRATTTATLHAFANVCRHRGASCATRPIPPSSNPSADRRRSGAPTTRGPTGSTAVLLATPRVDDEFDRDDHGLWPYRADVWNGLVFVSLADSRRRARRLAAGAFARSVRVRRHPDRRADRSVQRTDVGGRGQLEDHRRELRGVPALPVVHPELVDVIPLYRTGHVRRPRPRRRRRRTRSITATASRATGVAALPVLPGIVDDQEHRVSTGSRSSRICSSTSRDRPRADDAVPGRSRPHGRGRRVPVRARRCRLARASTRAEVIAFNELVGRAGQRGVRAGAAGVSSSRSPAACSPHKDDLVASFNRHYLDSQGSSTRSRVHRSHRIRPRRLGFDHSKMGEHRWSPPDDSSSVSQRSSACCSEPASRCSRRAAVTTSSSESVPTDRGRARPRSRSAPVLQLCRLRQPRHGRVVRGRSTASRSRSPRSTSTPKRSPSWPTARSRSTCSTRPHRTRSAG